MWPFILSNVKNLALQIAANRVRFCGISAPCTHPEMARGGVRFQRDGNNCAGRRSLRGARLTGQTVLPWGETYGDSRHASKPLLSFSPRWGDPRPKLFLGLDLPYVVSRRPAGTRKQEVYFQMNSHAWRWIRSSNGHKVRLKGSGWVCMESVLTTGICSGLLALGRGETTLDSMLRLRTPT